MLKPHTMLETRIQIRHLENCFKYKTLNLEKERMLNCVILLQKDDQLKLKPCSFQKWFLYSVFAKIKYCHKNGSRKKGSILSFKLIKWCTINDQNLNLTIKLITIILPAEAIVMEHSSGDPDVFAGNVVSTFGTFFALKPFVKQLFCLR